MTRKWERIFLFPVIFFVLILVFLLVLGKEKKEGVEGRKTERGGNNRGEGA